MIKLENFDWGWMDQPSDKYHIFNDGSTCPIGEYHKMMMLKEIFIDKSYEKFFEVSENDIVVDIGASVGPFTYSVLHKNPKHIYCLEPSESEFKTLVKNTQGNCVTPIFKGISDSNSLIKSNKLFGGESTMESITFKKFIDLYNLQKIDFLKTDCEGGEYDIFNQENFEFIKNNINKISGEWHLSTLDLKHKFRIFRDLYLNYFTNFEVYSIDGIDIKWNLWDESFISYYNEILIYIDNSK
jgi:FkbM family methyltransferase